ncbi:OmpP1/FadL family transporter [Acanthopleuribacter pedis]|uniref:Outer membrane protein transport protein n=1 Tax=Acanthopleuribacter pedis TaxID=442870 RepID=A0A8J7Q6B6_9BACT|nr:outer membrane protein transport protein [Acanthopleuribacter pedis]MBO1321307.1 outer membrane protein transport protein [Acanthopleuribacter pedis]
MKKLFFLLIPLIPLGLFAQNDMYANINLQFRFTNPGARAQAMGGAFIGLADDTTAILANPAGLANMTSTTLIGEFSQLERDNNIPFYSGTITQSGLQDFIFDLNERDFPESVSTIPFLAYVHTKSKIKWGVYYAEQAHFDRTFETNGVTIPPFRGQTYLDLNQFVFFSASRNFIELQMRSIGGSVGINLTDRLAVGVTVSYNDFQYEGNTSLLVPDFAALFPDFSIDPRVLDAIAPFVGQAASVIDVDGDDGAISANIGLLYTPNERFSVGFAYKQQPEFDYDHRTSGLRTDDLSFDPLPVENGSAVFSMPDSFGAGFSFKPTDVFLVTLEVNRVMYSEMSDDFHTFFGAPNDPADNRQVVSDTTEYRAGMEYILVNLQNPLSLRAGYYLEPYHALQNEKLDTQILFAYTNPAGDLALDFRNNAFLQRFAEDQNHITFGAGMSFGQHFAIDLAADIADRSESYSLSGIYRF